jgi:hypothetical protein
MKGAVMIDADEIVRRLEEAGETLLALPGGQMAPRFAQMGWTTVNAAVEAYGWNAARMRAPVPSGQAIDRMDEAFRWVMLVDGVAARRIVQARSLVVPLKGYHLYSWRQVGRLIGADYRAVQRWHRQAIEQIQFGLDQMDQSMRHKSLACGVV